MRYRRVCKRCTWITKQIKKNGKITRINKKA